MNSGEPDLPPIVPLPPDVPVFNCVIHLSFDEQGRVLANAVNLEGIQCIGDSQRDAISKLVPLFKERVAALHHTGKPIPWSDVCDPPEGTQVLLIPVHL